MKKQVKAAKLNGRKGGRPRKPEPRRYCPSCEASITSTDEQAGYCTNCGKG